jgi:hypothetical protein
MEFSIRLTRKACAPLMVALMFGCGSNDEGTPGSTGTLGTGGAGGSSAGTAGSAGATGMGDGSAGAGGASGSGGTGGAEGGTGKGGAAGKGGSAGKDAGGDAMGGGAGKAGSAGAGGGAGTAGDAGMVSDARMDREVSTPPMTDASRPPGDASTDDLIKELVARIKPEEIEPRYRTLETMFSMPNRKTGTANYTAATEWVKGWLATEAPRLTVTFDDWSGSRNIEIKIAGTDPAAGMYVIGGHLDSVTASPGMDDDGSGSLGTAILASAMSHYVYKSEIRLMLFDGEESGFVGSTHYAQALLAAGCQPDTCLKLFINLDMIGYDPMDTGVVRVRFDLAGPKMVAQQVKGYVAGLTVTEGTGNCHSSDDCGFSRQGYPAGELIEPTNNPQWHKVGDTCDNMNFKTINKALQLAGAMLATMGGIHGRAP